MLAFKPPSGHSRGTILRLFRQSYAEMMLADLPYWRNEEEDWSRFDQEVFENPDTVGRCVFISLSEGAVVGLGSFDPRHGPEYGTIGHNCILPEFRGSRFGKQQVEELCARLRARGFKRAVVSTGDHPFFLPAQRMYLSCGFKETRRDVDGARSNPQFNLIKYEKQL